MLKILLGKATPKVYKYRINIEYSADRDKFIRAIYAADPTAEVKPETSWQFRVRTRLTSTELFYYCTTKLQSYKYGGIDKITRILWF